MVVNVTQVPSEYKRQGHHNLPKAISRLLFEYRVRFAEGEGFSKRLLNENPDDCDGQDS